MNHSSQNLTEEEYLRRRAQLMYRSAVGYKIEESMGRSLPPDLMAMLREYLASSTYYGRSEVKPGRLIIRKRKRIVHPSEHELELRRLRGRFVHRHKGKRLR